MTANPGLENAMGVPMSMQPTREELETMRQRAARFESVVVAYQEELAAVPKGIRRGLGEVRWMFWMQYLIGLVLILTAAFLVLIHANDRGIADFKGVPLVLSLLFGVGGIGTMLYTTHKASPIFLQKNRVDLAQLNMASFAWLHTVMGLTEYLSMRSKTLQQQGRTEDALEWATFKDGFDQIMACTEKALAMIEQNCDLERDSGLASRLDTPPPAMQPVVVAAPAATPPGARPAVPPGAPPASAPPAAAPPAGPSGKGG